MAVVHSAPRIHGLSEREVRERQARGQVNRVPIIATRSYVQILRENVFTFINNCLFALGLVLLLLGRPFDALIGAGVVLINAIASSAQEVRAKQQLDRIALLYRPRATVLRDGREHTIVPEAIVQGDVVKAVAGDQILVDGSVMTGRIEVDESQLTGESDLITKLAGDILYSGTSVVGGSGLYVAEKIGAASMVHELTAKARAFRRVTTPLQRDINMLVRLFLLTVLYLQLIVGLNALLHETGLVQAVQRVSLVAGLIPNGLFLTIAVAYAISSVRLLRFGVLVQQSNAIESLSHVDTLCIDKTGTLTANRLQIHRLHPLNGSLLELENMLGMLVASARSGNKTSEAIAQAYPRQAQPLVAEVPFSSARKWSAVALEAADIGGVWVLGAVEFLESHLEATPDQWTVIREQSAAWAEQGLRVLLLAHHPNAHLLHDEGDRSRLPDGMQPIGLISLSDELRPEARETLAAFLEAGVQPKIISGDHPQTVSALARQFGLPSDLVVVSGPELATMNETAFADAAESATIFGRITPQQKEQLVRALRQRGRYVAMIGDGVNDVLSLKQAQLGIAMQSGSQATRNVADIVLTGDSFAALVPAVREGQKIVNGMRDVLALFLTRVATMALVIIAILAVSSQTFPLTLIQGALIAFVTVGIPTPLIALWARSGAPAQGDVLRRLLQFMAAPALLGSIGGLLVFAGTLLMVGITPTALAEAQTALTSFLVLIGLVLVVFVQPPTTWWTGIAEACGDWRPAISALVALVLYCLVLIVPPFRTLATLAPLGFAPVGLVIGCAVVWTLALRFVWRGRMLERLLRRA